MFDSLPLDRFANLFTQPERIRDGVQYGFDLISHFIRCARLKNVNPGFISNGENIGFKKILSSPSFRSECDGVSVNGSDHPLGFLD